jgi:hypothetical protein
MGLVQVRTFQFAVLVFAIGVVLAPRAVHAGTHDKPRDSQVHLISGTEPSQNNAYKMMERQKPSKAQRESGKINYPNLSSLGLDLKNTGLAKRNELDSMIVRPWAPGRGALGVKVEVTW